MADCLFAVLASLPFFFFFFPYCRWSVCAEKESVERIKRFMTIMDSFTAEELDSTMQIFNTTPNRLVRIARGAGVQLRHVHEVLETYKPFKKVASKMGGLGQHQDGQGDTRSQACGWNGQAG